MDATARDVRYSEFLAKRTQWHGDSGFSVDLEQLAATVPDLLIQDCASCGEHLASRLQPEKLLERSGLRVIAGKKPSEVRGHDRPYCSDCLNARGN